MLKSWTLSVQPKMQHDMPKEALREYQRQYREANSERLKERQRQYYLKNREKILARSLKYGSENREAVRKQKRERYRTNPDVRRNAKARAAKWSAINPKKVLEVKRRWLQKNPEKRSAAVHKYYKAHPEKTTRARERRRADLARVECDGHTIPELHEYWRARGIDPKRCTYCDAWYRQWKNNWKASQGDHVLAIHNGGSHTMDNIVPCCITCNQSKADRILYVEWTPPNMRKAA